MLEKNQGYRADKKGSSCYDKDTILTYFQINQFDLKALFNKTQVSEKLVSIPKREPNQILKKRGLLLLTILAAM